MKIFPLLLQQKKFARCSFLSICQLILFISFTSNVDAGWFGYDTYAECMEKEPGKLMTRWISPLSEREAKNAAKEICKAYPNEYQLKLRSMSDAELLAEQKKLLGRKHPSVYGYWIKAVSEEKKRRNLK